MKKRRQLRCGGRFRGEPCGKLLGELYENVLVIRCPRCESYTNFELFVEGPQSPPGREPTTGSQNPPTGH